MKLTVNPWKDVLVSREMDGIALEIHKELQQYDGVEPSTTSLEQSKNLIQNILTNRLQTIARISFKKSLEEIGNYKAPTGFEVQLMLDVRQKAFVASSQIIRTTGITFGLLEAAMGKKVATSKERSRRIADDQGPRIFFESRRRGWGLRHGVKKAWYTQNENSCELCLENEDEGPIPVDEAFPSGDLGPLAHIGCDCLMSLII